MTLAERQRPGTRPTLIDASWLRTPEVSQLKLFRSAIAGFEIPVPKDWRKIIERADHVMLAPDVEPGRPFSQLDFYRDPYPFMSAEDMVMKRMSNEIETVQKPIQATVDGIPAWLIDICNHPTKVIDASKEPGAIRTECVFNDPSGAVRTFALRSASAVAHEEEKRKFMRMLSSFRLIKQ